MAQNAAVTVVVPFTVTVQVVLVPEQAPDQPPNTQLLPGAAVRTTVVPAGYAWLQVLPQSMPAGVLVTVPVPCVITDSVGFGDGCVTHGPNVIVYALPLP